MKKIFIFCIVGMMSLTSADAQFGNLLDKAKKVVNGESEDVDIAGGLKEALEKGVGDAVRSLAKENGYYDSPYRILIPEDAQKVVSTVSKVPGFTDVEQQMVTKMNEAAELAVKEATPIFLDAISNMSFEDARNILFGEDDAATDYLQMSSRKKLYDKFLPIIQSALDQVDATKYWKDVVTQYNRIPLTRDLNPDLDDHVNNKALDGIFSLIEKKETKIRHDVGHRTSPLLREVFAKID